jgi:hypothetical protein
MAEPGLDRKVPKTPFVPALDVASAAHVEAVGGVRAASGVVAVRAVAVLAAALATPALRNGARKVLSQAVMRTGSSVVASPTANAAGSLRFPARQIRKHRSQQASQANQPRANQQDLPEGPRFLWALLREKKLIPHGAVPLGKVKTCRVVSGLLNENKLAAHVANPLRQIGI